MIASEEQYREFIKGRLVVHCNSENEKVSFFLWARECGLDLSRSAQTTLEFPDQTNMSYPFVHYDIPHKSVVGMANPHERFERVEFDDFFGCDEENQIDDSFTDELFQIIGSV